MITLRKSSVIKIGRYVGFRAITVAVAIVVAVYLTIVIANAGGYVDEIIISELRFKVYEDVRTNPAYRGYTPEEIKRIAEERIELEIKKMGLDQHFMIRSFNYLYDALTLNLGRAMKIFSSSGSSKVWDIIGERLPTTILLFTTANVLIFLCELFIGLSLSRRYGSKVDKLAVSLAPLSSMPGWFYGIFMIIVFASWLGVLPYGGLVDAPPPADPLLYALSVLKHMILPLLSWAVAYIPIGVYRMRTFFLMFSMEDYVDYARVRGVPPKIIERRYILRPVLPPVITDFVLVLISSWMGAIVTERVFNWPGVGTLMAIAIAINDVPVIIGTVAIYAYLLGISVIVLDLVYAIVDPRIRVGE
ncbi:MAG: ABC transporter permease [Sulfolobales archaeon]